MLRATLRRCSSRSQLQALANRRSATSQSRAAPPADRGGGPATSVPCIAPGHAPPHSRWHCSAARRSSPHARRRNRAAPASGRRPPYRNIGGADGGWMPTTECRVARKSVPGTPRRTGYATGAEGAMREIAMVAGTDRKNAHCVKYHAERYGMPCHAGPDGGQASGVNEQEADAGRIGDVIVALCAHAHDEILMHHGYAAGRRARRAPGAPTSAGRAALGV